MSLLARVDRASRQSAENPLDGTEQTSQQHEFLGRSDHEFGQVASTFRRAVITVIGLAAVGSLAGAWHYQPATVLGFATIVAIVSATALLVAATVAFVQFR